MTNYHYRKYEGAPHSEKKRHAAQPPSKLGPRKTSHDRPVRHIKSLSSLAPHDSRWWWSSRKRSSPINPHVGYPLSTYQLYSAAEHVIRRLKANLIEDTTLKIYWVEAQATHAQLTPVFHNFTGIVSWLLYEGLSRGWLTVETYWTPKSTWRGKVHPAEHLAKLNKR